VVWLWCVRCDCGGSCFISLHSSLTLPHSVHTGDTPLIKACRQGQLECVRVLLGSHLVTYATVAGSLPAAAESTAQRSDADKSGALSSKSDTQRDCSAQLAVLNAQGQSALHVAAECGHAGIVRLLLEAGLAVDSRDAGGRSALMLCRGIGSESGVAHTVEVLLGGGADPLAVDSLGNTLLQQGHAHHAVLSLVLDRCTAAQRDQLLTATNAQGQSALDVACQIRNLDVAQLLCARGCSHNTCSPADLGGVLHLAAPTHKYRALLEVLVGLGADVNEEVNGKSALLVAGRLTLILMVVVVVVVVAVVVW
jgi:ankyrin repeat protein